jgi:hypothetical protein
MMSTPHHPSPGNWAPSWLPRTAGVEARPGLPYPMTLGLNSSEREGKMMRKRRSFSFILSQTNVFVTIILMLIMFYLDGSFIPFNL